MIDPNLETYAHELFSGQRSNPLLLALLRALSWVFGPIATFRHWLYDARLKGQTRVGVPVISVGNITTGGTGKTPMVIYLCDRLLRAGKKVAVVSRGYGAHEGELNDEAMLIKHRFPHVITVCHPDRVLAAKTAVAQGAEIIVADDGFNHRRLDRDVNIVMLAPTNPWGYGYVLPRGLLREPLGGLRRADMVVSQCDDADVIATLRRHNPKAPLFHGFKRVTHVKHLHKDEHIDLRGHSVKVVCGIGTPQSFTQTLNDLGAHIMEQINYADHHNYTDADITEISHMETDVPVVITEKDAAKIAPMAPQLQNTYVVVIDMVVPGFKLHLGNETF